MDLGSILASASPGDRLSVAAPEPLVELPGSLPRLLAAPDVPVLHLELSLSGDRAIRCTVELILALSAVRDLGVDVALAGVRHHHLKLLPRLPLSALILEPGLIACLPRSELAFREVRAVVAAAKSLGLHTVAPGIETWEQYAQLRECGVAKGEGELFDPR